MKIKHSDKVLLPLQLDAYSMNGNGSAESNPCKFSLCAIMRHKGTSAYSGHYVAEAMDWRTGQWFEFNDANVIHLKKGPLCSYDPGSMALEDCHDQDSSLVGSADAYNMYYVEQSFLAQSVQEKLRGNVGIIKEPIPASLMSETRQEYYKDLHQYVDVYGNHTFPEPTF
jgi:Ubiquitin carboxyl-terminal hydrolase